MSNVEDGWANANNYWPVRKALDSGVFAIMLDFYYFEGEVHVCHGFCNLGRMSGADQLEEIAGFVLYQPNVVIHISCEARARARECVARR